MLTSYSFGSDRELLNRYGWFSDNSEGWFKPVGEFPSDSRGLFDMHDNLWEWVHDFNGGDRGEEVIDPIGPERGSNRVFHGGSWYNEAAICRSANRNFDSPTIRTISNGFRQALSSPSGDSSPAEQGEGQGVEPAGAGTEGASA